MFHHCGASLSKQHTVDLWVVTAQRLYMYLVCQLSPSLMCKSYMRQILKGVVCMVFEKPHLLT